jgi:hypothetical protein
MERAISGWLQYGGENTHAAILGDPAKMPSLNPGDENPIFASKTSPAAPYIG